MLKFSVLVVCVLCVVNVSSREEVYSNSWAVEVRGGHLAADKLAKKHGFVNKGQVGSLDDMYHFVHEDSPTIVKRSSDVLHPKHSDLSAEEHVHYVEQQIVKTRVKRDHSYIYSSPTDNKWNSQWYLHRPNGHHMNVEKAWEQDIIGRGAVVSILDDGLEHSHPDLKDNYDPLASYDFNDHDGDPFPRYDYSNENKHGTRCAGEVAANKNGKCGVGAAYGSRVGGVRMLDGSVTDVVEASSLSLNPQHIDIYSSSWGPTDDGATIDGPGPLAKKAFLDGIEKGRGGLGSLYLWAAGNGGRYGDSCNCDGYAVSPYSISVGSAGENDDIPWYLEKCSSTITSTYSSGSASEKQIVSTDLHGKCTAHHTGTSAAAPLAAGILALTLEANSNLTWRDVQYLLVYTSNPDFAHEDSWTTNGAGLRVSHMYGFGIMDATALVNRARNWITVSPRLNCSVNVTKTLGNNNIATTSHPLNVKVSFASDCVVSYIEHTQAFVTLKLAAGLRKDVSITLTSPQGTKSVLLPHRRSDRHKDGIHNWPFMTVHTWGEKPNGGEWTFTVNSQNGAKVVLLGLELVVHGTEGAPRALRNTPAECDPQCKGGCSAPGPEFCDDCKHFRMSSTLACIPVCPDGTFQNHHMCRDCPDFCTECSNEHTCEKCVDGAVRLDSGLCAEGCPALTYLAQDHTCKTCHHSCLSCDGPTDHNCTDCPGQLSLQDGECVIRTPESCSTGQYFDHRGLECRSCHMSCENCTGKESNQCTGCYGEFMLTSDGRCDMSKILSCEAGMYFNVESSLCILCADRCSNCTSNTTCTLCEEPFYLSTNGSCLEHCPNRTVTENKTHTCLDTLCSEHCLTCYGPQSNGCTSCEEGSLLFENSCVEHCPEHTFLVDNSTCKHCHESCASCCGDSSQHCLSCSDSKYLHQNHCMSACPAQTFASGNECLPCGANCSQCSSTSTCDVCQDGYLLLNSDHSCVKDCPAGFVKQPSTSSCLPCQSNCIECYDLSSCHKCVDNFVYYAPNRSCQSRCPDGYFLNAEKTHCLECKHPCSTCVGSATHCLTCAREMVLDKTTKQCQYCCNSDKAIALPCCDCDASTTECVIKERLDTQEPLVLDDDSNSGHFVLIGLASIVIVTLLVIVAGLTILYVRRRRGNHSGMVKRYQTLQNEPLEIVDDSGSEAEIYSAKVTRGYTSIDTIDHDNI